MELILYSAFSKRRNSTKRPTSGQSRQVEFKAPTTVENPTFLLSGVNVGFNFCYVPSWDRYYFVENFRVGNTNHFEIDCSTDVLATFKDTILSSYQFVERSSSNYNVMFNDSLVSTTQQVTNRQVKQLTGLGFSYNNHCFGIRIAGGDSDGISTYFVESLDDLAPIFDKTKYFQSSDDSWIQMVGNYVFDPYDYVVDLFFVPIPFNTIKQSAYTTASFIYVKWFFTGIGAYKLKDGATMNFIATLNGEPTNIYSDFRKYNPSFSKYSIELPAIGIVPLDGNNIENLKVTYTVQLDTGSTAVWLQNNSSMDTIADFKTNVFTKLQYGSDALNLSELGSNVLSSIGGFASGNPVLGAVGLVNAVHNTIVPTPSLGGSHGGVGLIYNTSPTIYLNNYGSGGLDVVNLGRPLYQRVQLNTLTGFCKCGNASLDVAGYGTDKDKVNAYLNSGFFIE